ncbi:MAG TPA: acyltransferase [Candidatus Binatia bacterium]|jgi:acetyltransferase-like isoleucine patch superfamily enzyme|nr:acyltransferase [Candidatus Binatia bacterium]
MSSGTASFQTLNSPKYDLSRLATSGEDVFVSANVEIRRPHLVRLGSHIAIDSGFYCTTAVTLGDYIHIGPYVTVIGGEPALLRMAGFNTIGAGSRILCASDEFLGAGLVGMAPPEFRDIVHIAPVVFGAFASLGTNVVVHPGVTLAEGSVVGSCSLLTRSTEPWTIYRGVPARPWKARPKEKMLAAARKLGYGPFGSEPT